VRYDWVLLSLWRAARRSIRPAPQRPLRIAGVMAVHDYSDEVSAFDALASLCDVTIVLDDNSTPPFPHRERCDEYLRLDNRGPWNDLANRTLLMYRARVHGCDWVVSIDHDVAYSHDFQTRADAARLIGELAARGLLGRLRRGGVDGLGETGSDIVDSAPIGRAVRRHSG